jgi:hypothetical protein
MTGRALLLVCSALSGAAALPGVSRAADPEVITLVVCSAVQDRAPVGESDWFPGDVEEVFAHVTLEHDDPNETEVQLEWAVDGRSRSTSTLRVGRSFRWRTWSRRKIHESDVGRWTVRVRAESGQVLGERAFRVGIGAPEATAAPLEVAPPPRDAATTTWEGDLDGDGRPDRIVRTGGCDHRGACLYEVRLDPASGAKVAWGPERVIAVYASTAHSDHGGRRWRDLVAVERGERADGTIEPVHHILRVRDGVYLRAR